MNDLIDEVIDWGYCRGLHDTTDLRPQLTRLTMELGNVAVGVTRKDQAKILDSAGDLLVALIQFGAVYARTVYPKNFVDRSRLESEFLHIALAQAWGEIKSRERTSRDGIPIQKTPK